MLKQLLKNTPPQIHTRDIKLATHAHTKERVIVQGSLKDRRLIPIFDITGTLREPGIVHHMEVTFLIRPNPLSIEDAYAQMHTVPMQECRQTLDTIEQLKGIQIQAGFSKQIRSIMGGKKGCAHLCNLVISMGQEIVHGWLTHQRKEPSAIPDNTDNFNGKKYIIDSCRMWTGSGPKMKALEHAIQQRNSDTET